MNQSRLVAGVLVCGIVCALPISNASESVVDTTDVIGKHAEHAQSEFASSIDLLRKEETASERDIDNRALLDNVPHAYLAPHDLSIINIAIDGLAVSQVTE